MLIIDEGAEARLAEMLEALKQHPKSSRCIYFALTQQPSVAGIRERVMQATRRYLKETNAHIYFCDDGDIFIVASSIPMKDGHWLIHDVAAFLGIPAYESWVSFYDISLHIHRIHVLVEQKLTKKQQAEQALKKQRELQIKAERRDAILNTNLLGCSDDIKARRNGRHTPEILIIEDDAFSRKLVENVLQKSFPLTALGSTELALESYVRLAPDIVFLDINLPDVTGHELLEKFIALDSDAYVIMLSGNADRDNITQAMQLGAKGFIAKPFTREKIFQYIERCPTIKAHAIF